MKKFYFASMMILSLIIAFFVKGTVHSMETENKEMAYESYYKSCEKEYVNEIKQLLNDSGLENAGVMLTKTITANGQRDYVLSIHHKKEVGENVLGAIKDVELPIKGARISVMTTT